MPFRQLLRAVLIYTVFLLPLFSAEEGQDIFEGVLRSLYSRSRKVSVSIALVSHEEEITYDAVLYQEGTRRRSKMIFAFTSPEDVKGMSILMKTGKSIGQGERYLYMPATKQVEEIDEEAVGQYLGGFDIGYEGLLAMEEEDIAHKYIGDSNVLGNDCYIVESVNKTNSSEFVHAVSLVRKDIFYPIVVSVYNRKGMIVKTISAENLEEIDGVWTAKQTVIMDANGEKTMITIHKIEYNLFIKDDFFSVETLKSESIKY